MTIEGVDYGVATTDKKDVRSKTKSLIIIIDPYSAGFRYRYGTYMPTIITNHIETTHRAKTGGPRDSHSHSHSHHPHHHDREADNDKNRGG